jgi:ParB family chromosome partitioning protein
MNTNASLPASESTTPAVALKPGKPGKKSKAPRGADKAARPAKGAKAARAPKADRVARKSRKARGDAPVSDCERVAAEAPAEPVVSDGKPLPMVEVYPNPNQPRKLFSQPEIEELAASIAHNGQLQPIKVVPRPQVDGPGKYMIVLGERRWRAHQHLGLATIQATVSEMTDDQVADAAIVENLQRKDITPLEEARAFQARLNTGLTVDELAKRLGMKQSWRITERTALLKLTAEHQEALARGALTPSQAYEMSRLGPAMQRVLFNALAAGRCRSFAELRKTVEALAAREKQTSMPADAPEAAPATDADHDRVRALEATIGKVTDLLQRGFDTDDIAEVLADKLELIEGHLRQLRLELRAAAVAQGPAQADAEPAEAPAAEAADEVPSAGDADEAAEPGEPAEEAPTSGLAPELTVELDPEVAAAVDAE